MSRNTPIGKGQWVRPVPSDCDPDHVNWKLFWMRRRYFGGQTAGFQVQPVEDAL